MKKYTKKAINDFVAMRIAKDITNYNFEQTKNFYHEHDLEKIGYSTGLYGINAGLLKDCKTGELFAITARNTALSMLF